MLTVVVALVLFAQTIIITPPELPPLPVADIGETIQPYSQGYTTADPVRPDGIGLATQAGRYAITPIELCDGLYAGLNVEVYLTDDNGVSYWLGIDGIPCHVLLGERVSLARCFMNADGLCDIAAEAD